MGKESMRKIMLLSLNCLVLTVVAVLALPVVGQATATTTSLRIAAPLGNVWVSEKKLYLAGVDTAAGVKAVKIQGVKSDGGKNGIKVQPGGVFGSFVTLSKGMNNITVISGKNRVQLKVFYTADRRKKVPPKNFKHFTLHKKPTPLNCKDCHRFKKGKYDFKRVKPAAANCTTSRCHQKVTKGAHVHGPVGAGVCIACHNPHGSTNDKFLERDGQDLCIICHQARKAEFSQKVIHAPVEDGCIDCHDPHSSSMRFQLRAEGDTVSALCFNCHEEEIFTQKARHEPVAEGDCIACHRPHSSPNESLLIASKDAGELCFECHEDRKEEFTMENVHPPAEEDCCNCHDPHSSKNEYQLVEAGGKLCANCHEELNPEIFTAIKTAKVQHPPVEQGKCPQCHRPHSSNFSSLLQKPMEKLCFSCHTDLGDIVNESKNRHGPVKTGDCTACHNVHGSEFAKLLARYYPMDFYSEYGAKYYDLCFGCHNKDIAKTKTTTTLTNFRDGNYNLHYFHVNRKKGRTCTACHDPHASNQAKHIRYEVPYGAWSYPINITLKPTGGTCVVGCHAPKTYDRKNPKLKRR